MGMGVGVGDANFGPSSMNSLGAHSLIDEPASQRALHPLPRRSGLGNLGHEKPIALYTFR